MKRMVMLVIALGALGVLAATPAAAQVRVSGYIVVGSPIGFGRVEVVRPYWYYRGYRPAFGVERVRVYRPHRRAWRREWRGRGW